MSGDAGTVSEAYLVVPGDAADHLYREGSAKASFWEAIFGSSLRASRRTHVSALADGTRVFDVPLGGVEEAMLQSVGVWMTSPSRADACRDAATALTARRVRVKLIGLQPRGHAVASFTLRFEPVSPERAASPEITEALRWWFAEDGPRLARETLIPFGFTPRQVAAPLD